MKSSMKLKWNCWEGLKRTWQNFENREKKFDEILKKKKKRWHIRKKIMNITEDIWKGFENNC